MIQVVDYDQPRFDVALPRFGNSRLSSGFRPAIPNRSDTEIRHTSTREGQIQPDMRRVGGRGGDRRCACGGDGLLVEVLGT
ncbi:MAG: hypothetical protein ACLP50_27315 [Solirubrobacteraceae bacterium]